MKKAKDENEARSIEQKYDEQAHASVQWKGTDVCMDIYCKCGAMGHIDDDFVYHLKCLECGTIYYCNPNIELIEIEKNPEWGTIEFNGKYKS